MNDTEIKSVIDGLDEISGMPCEQMIRGDNDVLIRGIASNVIKIIHELKSENDRLQELHKPKRVVYQENPFTLLPVSHCPSCSKKINMYAYGYSGFDDFLYRNCPYCGQALEWEVTDDGCGKG